MISITRWQWFLVLSLSALTHFWILSYGIWDHRPKPPPTATEVVIRLANAPDEAREAAIDEAVIEPDIPEALEPQPESIEAVDIEVPEVVATIEEIELVSVEETAALEAEVSDAIDALAVEVVEVVGLVAEEPAIEEVSGEEAPLEVAVTDNDPLDHADVVQVATVSETAAAKRRSASRAVRSIRGPRPSELSVQPILRSYLSAVQAVLQRNKRYPDASRRAGEQGLVVLQFVLGRFGQILTYEIENSSGHTTLDSEAVSLIRRVRFPPMPGELNDSSIEFVVPLRFALN